MLFMFHHTRPRDQRSWIIDMICDMGGQVVKQPTQHTWVIDVRSETDAQRIADNTDGNVIRASKRR